MQPSPEQSESPEIPHGTSEHEHLNRSFEVRQNALAKAIYKQMNSRDGPTDQDWEDIFEHLKKDHEKLLSDMGIDTWSKLQEFSLQRSSIYDLRKRLRDTSVTNKEMEDFVKNQPDILTEACKKLSLFDLCTNASFVLPYISRLSEKADIITAIGKDEDLAVILHYADNIQPYCFAMLQARIESGKETLYRDTLQYIFDELSSKHMALESSQLQWFQAHMINDDSPDTHQARLIYTNSRRSNAPWTDFRDEPALQGMMQVKEDWIDFPLLGREATPEVKTQVRAMIARKLFLLQRPVSEISVRAVWSLILDAREKYRDLPLFQGRNVLVIAHGEKYDKEYTFNPKVHGTDDNRFGRTALMEEINKQQGEDVPPADRVRPVTQSDEDVETAKKDAIAKIISLPVPATFFFDMHGAQDAVYFRNGEITRDGNVKEAPAFAKITVEELAECFKARAEKYGDLLRKKETQDIIISQACYSSNFMSDLYTRLGTLPKPMAVGASEYNLQSISAVHDEPLGSKFSAKILDLDGKHDGSVSTVGDIFDNELSGLEDNDIDGGGLRTNPIVLIPDEDNEILQITGIDKKKGNTEDV